MAGRPIKLRDAKTWQREAEQLKRLRNAILLDADMSIGEAARIASRIDVLIADVQRLANRAA